VDEQPSTNVYKAKAYSQCKSKGRKCKIKFFKNSKEGRGRRGEEGRNDPNIVCTYE
jgi:hypothetical protein